MPRDEITLRPPHYGELPLLADIQTAYYKSCGVDDQGDLRLLRHIFFWSRTEDPSRALAVAIRRGSVLGMLERGLLTDPEGSTVRRWRLHLPAESQDDAVGLLQQVESKSLREDHSDAVYGTWCYTSEAVLIGALLQRGYVRRTRMYAFLRFPEDTGASAPSNYRLLRCQTRARVAELRGLYEHVEGAGDVRSLDYLLSLPDWSWNDSYYALDDQGEIVGAVLTRRHFRGLYVEWLGVRAASRGRGVGRALLAALHDSTSVPLLLDVDARNDPAIALYASSGYMRYPMRDWGTFRRAAAPSP